MSENRSPNSTSVSPEDAERLAERFKPSWELDDAPFTAPEQVGELQALAQPVAPEAASAVAEGAAFSVPAAPLLPGSLAGPSPVAAAVTATPAIPEPSVAPIAAPVEVIKKAKAKAKYGRTMLGIAPPAA